MILLPDDDYISAIRALKEVTFNSLFARSVVEKHVNGKVYVDDISSPKAFYVVHPYGMVLLYGDISERFLQFDLKNTLFERSGLQKAGGWLQVFPQDLEDRIDVIFKDRISVFGSSEFKDDTSDKIVKHKRVNFRFNLEKYNSFRCGLDITKYCFCDINVDIFNETNGSVVPNRFWNNANDFVSNGAGFSLIVDDHPVSIAFSSFVHEGMFELGMETKSEFRRRGYASIVCARLIDYCLERGFEPIWACRLGNGGSYELAIRLGFEPIAYLPYYELKNYYLNFAHKLVKK